MKEQFLHVIVTSYSIILCAGQLCDQNVPLESFSLSDRGAWKYFNMSTEQNEMASGFHCLRPRKSLPADLVGNFEIDVALTAGTGQNIRITMYNDEDLGCDVTNSSIDFRGIELAVDATENFVSLKFSKEPLANRPCSEFELTNISYCANETIPTILDIDGGVEIQIRVEHKILDVYACSYPVPFTCHAIFKQISIDFEELFGKTDGLVFDLSLANPDNDISQNLTVHDIKTFNCTATEEKAVFPTTTKYNFVDMIRRPNGFPEMPKKVISEKGDFDSEITQTRIQKVSETSSVKSQLDFFPSKYLEYSKPVFDADTLLEECDHFAPFRTAPPRNTHIRLTFAADKFLGIDTIQQRLSVGATMFMAWQVDTCPYNGSITSTSHPEEVFVPHPSAVWTPDWRFLGSANSNVYMKQQDVNLYGEDLLVTHHLIPSFRVLDFYWLQGGAFSASCAIDVTRFPFDRHTCIFAFALLRSTSLVRFNQTQVEFSWPIDDIDADWRYVGKEVVIGEAFYRALKTDAVYFSITLERNPTYYITNLVVPTAVLAIVEIGTFILPPQEPDRPALSMTVLLAITFSQSTIMDLVPKTSKGILLGDYTQYLSWLCTACLVYQMAACCFAGHSDSVEPERSENCQPPCKTWTWMRFADLLAFTGSVACLIWVHIYFLKSHV